MTTHGNSEPKGRLEWDLGVIQFCSAMQSYRGNLDRSVAYLFGRELEELLSLEPVTTSNRGLISNVEARMAEESKHSYPFTIDFIDKNVNKTFWMIARYTFDEPLEKVRQIMKTSMPDVVRTIDYAKNALRPSVNVDFGVCLVTPTPSGLATAEKATCLTLWMAKPKKPGAGL